MLDKPEKSKHLGTFTIGPDREVSGELTLAGLKTSLYLWDKDSFGGWGTERFPIKGVLDDLTKISLSDCVIIEGPSSHHRDGEATHYYKLYPHYAVFGNHHISFAGKAITDVSFVIDDATILFYDSDAFGCVSDARSLIDQVVQSRGIDREIRTGEFPIIAYFTGAREIFATNTVLGRVSASHNPSYGPGGPRGVEIKNAIFVSLQFAAPITFEDAMYRCHRILIFLGLLVGRPQNLVRFTVSEEGDHKQPTILEVYSSGFPKHERPENERSIQPFDVLLDAVQEPGEFSTILANWLERDETWRDARGRFVNNFTKEEVYDTNRLIGAANMFDILPKEAVPVNVELSEGLESAIAGCRESFRSLTQSPERDSVLNVLGRVGKSSLKQKIRHRGQLLLDRIGDNLPELFIVTDEAVNCRNHYVHGSQSRIDYSKESDILIFLTETLEFVFGASDLIEAGWDVKGWCASERTSHHPFGHYAGNYKIELSKLKRVITESGV